MNGMRKSILITFLVMFIFTMNHAFARDLAGIEWSEFWQSSQLVFKGLLVKAELVPDAETSELGLGSVRYTFEVHETYKGTKMSTVTFEENFAEIFNLHVGGLAIVALRKTKEGDWTLAVDERSCWVLDSETKPDFGGLAVYRLPSGLLYNVPDELGKKVKIKKLYADGWRDEEAFIYPARQVENFLRRSLE